jgi:hypothetical protein
MPNRMRVVRSEPIRQVVPFANQRLGIWAATPTASGRFQLAAALESRGQRPGYSVAVLSVGPDPGQGALTLSDSGITPGALNAAAFDYEKNHTQPLFNRAFLTNDGQLWAGKPARVKRSGIDLASPLPVVTTSYIYWGTRGADGTLTFEAL